MTEVLESKKLQFVSWCHLPPAMVRITQQIPVDPVQFPAAVEGFISYSVASEIQYYGTQMALYDISGLTRGEIADHLRRKHRTNRPRVPGIRFLQCLEWVHSDKYHDKFDFERIVAYLPDGDVVVAEPCDGGFRRIMYDKYDDPWPEGTLGLFNVMYL